MLLSSLEFSIVIDALIKKYGTTQYGAYTGFEMEMAKGYFVAMAIAYRKRHRSAVGGVPVACAY